ncbi:Protein zwilch [Pseudolycoriella hygida]|uniref:Protein zwilch n=1 Tax=Pseudolycoriella hygida TaxID=35572 RepID=A0A9Q0RX01_9DIPT|nr:Protein zwilch [Pseudolycoriella hygida]
MEHIVTISHIRDHIDQIHQILSKYEGVNADEVEPLSYIKTLAEPTGKILLLYKKIAPPAKLAIEKDISLSDNISRLDVTGTPLEDSFNITMISDWSVVKKIVNPWTDDEETYSSIDEELATDIINEINVCLGRKCKSGTVFAICDGTDDDNQFLLYAEYDPQWNWRGIGKFTGLVKFKEIDLSTMMQTHLNMLSHCNEANTKIETYFHIKSNQTIKCSWETTSLSPSLKCNKNANIVLSQSIPIGDFNSNLEEYWRQLEILQGIKQDIEKFKKTKNNADLVYKHCVSPLDLNKIKQHIMSALSTITSFDAMKVTDISDINSIISRMETDRIHDVTDLLWSVLRFCSSYKDLLHALNYVFQCAAQSIVVNTPRNSNRLAGLIRDVSEKRNIPRLSGSEPLEILLEIGLQKIRNDYEHIFTESKICSSAGFQAKMNDNTSKVQGNDRKTLHHAVESNRKTMLNKNNLLDITELNVAGYTEFNKAEIDQFLMKLAQVHLILEHIILMQVNLNLDRTVFRSILNSESINTADFSKFLTMKYDKREFAVSANDLLSKIQNLTPQVVKVTMKSENQFKFVRNTFFYSIDPICPLNVFPHMQRIEDVLNKEIIYCGLSYVKLGTRLK